MNPSQNPAVGESMEIIFGVGFSLMLAGVVLVVLRDYCRDRKACRESKG